MFDITASHRKRIYSWVQGLSAALTLIGAVLTPIAAGVTSGPFAPVLTSALALVGAAGVWVGKLAKDHTIVDDFLDAVDSTPGN